jgi:predicted MFS family arabinose efflux permease
MNDFQESRPSAGRLVASWSAIATLGIGAFALVTSEFVPVGLLPRIAEEIGITEGQAGLMVTVPGLVAAAAAALSVRVAGTQDRRVVLCFMLGLLVAAEILVATAKGFAVLLLGRVLLGVAVGGFWTIGGTMAAQLRPRHQSARATAVVMSGISIGTVGGVPAGVYLGDLFGGG